MRQLLMVIILALATTAWPEAARPQKAQPPEPSDATYKSMDGDIIAIISEDELELRDSDVNVVCKYSQQKGRLRVVINELGTATAMYFQSTPEGLVDEDGRVFYNSNAYERMLAKQQLDSALVDAISKGDTTLMQSLLAKGADPDQTIDACTLLTYAAFKEDAAMTELLLRHGANPDLKDAQGDTPLIVAAALGTSASGRYWQETARSSASDRIVQLLCDYNATLSETNSRGNCALELSLKWTDNMNAARVLIAAGADRGKAIALAGDDYERNRAARTPQQWEQWTNDNAATEARLVGQWELAEGRSRWVITYFRDHTYLNADQSPGGTSRYTGEWKVQGRTLFLGENGNWYERAIAAIEDDYVVTVINGSSSNYYRRVETTDAPASEEGSAATSSRPTRMPPVSDTSLGDTIARVKPRGSTSKSVPTKQDVAKALRGADTGDGINSWVFGYEDALEVTILRTQDEGASLDMDAHVSTRSEQTGKSASGVVRLTFSSVGGHWTLTGCKSVDFRASN